jgi:hypothetical protein
MTVTRALITWLSRGTFALVKIFLRLSPVCGIADVRVMCDAWALELRG